MSDSADAPNAARLLARERQIAAIESGADGFVNGESHREQHALITGLLQYDPARLALLLVPALEHPLCVLASEIASVTVTFVPPDMDEDGRRALGVALRNKSVQLLAVTPERLAQPKFVQFIRAQTPVVVAVAASERLFAARTDYCPRYETLRALRGLFPGVPVLALADVPLPPESRAAIKAALGLRIPGETDTAIGATVPAPDPIVPATTPDLSPPKVMEANDCPAPQRGPVRDYRPAHHAPAPEPELPTPPIKPQASVPGTIQLPAPTPRKVTMAPEPAPQPTPRRPIPIPDAVRALFPLFEREAPVEECVGACGQDAAWVHAALATFIRHTRRTHPFPWVDKPTYLRVSMAAGQTESTNPRLIGSVLGHAVDNGLIEVVLAALQNRQDSAR